MSHAPEQVVEQVIRPTGLLDPEDRRASRSTGQIDDLVGEINGSVTAQATSACWSQR